MANEDKGDNDSSNEWLLNSHKKFLENLKDVYYLAVLASLCVSIAAFTGIEYPIAQTYALTAATLFLIAFLSSFAVKIFSDGMSVIVTYITSGLGILMLFLVIVNLSSSVQLISSSYVVIFMILGLGVISQLYFHVIKFVNRTDKYSQILGACLTFSFTFILIFGIMGIIELLLRVNLIPSSYLIDVAFFANTGLMMVFAIMIKHRSKK